MARSKTLPPAKINPNKIKVRDPLLQKLILGATKAGAHKDRKKDADRKLARRKVDPEDQE